MDGAGPADELVAKLEALRASLRSLGAVVVAFSGGTDSALVAHVANEQLAERAVAATAVSPSLATDELEQAGDLARSWGMRFLPVPANELENEDYVRNDADRCYWCKTELMDVLGPVAASMQATVVLGVNVDDLGEHRPGQQAARERGAVFPLVDAGCTKEDVRSISRHLGLPTWDRPAAACLASRLPYGTPVTLETLVQVDRAEAGLRRLGFVSMRVRHYDDTARIEVPLEDLALILERRDAVVEAVKVAGYRYVTVDLEGFRSGNLNAALGL